MKIAVRYFTKSGNTEKVALAIAEAVGVMAEKVSIPLSEKVDLLFLGSAPYGFDIADEVKAFLQDNKEMIGKVVNFSTTAMVRSTYKSVRKVTDANGIAMAEEEFYCRGKFGPLHKKRPAEEDLTAAKTFAEKIVKGVTA